MLYGPLCAVQTSLNFTNLVRVYYQASSESQATLLELASGLLVLAEGGGEQPQQRLHLGENR